MASPRERELPVPPPTAPPDAVRAAIKARVLAKSLGGTAAPPTIAGRYQLIREIGRGGSGTVWEGRHESLRRPIAVKLLRGARRDADGAKRLLREAINVSRIGHPHIVQVHDVGTDEGGAPYLVMDLLEGESLACHIAREGALPWAEARQLGVQLCGALQAAHELGVIHRDVKPANIFVRSGPDGWHSTLLDFGLCTAPSGATALTAEGARLGTPGYMAPEQIRGESVDARADVYGIACVLVELLSGEPAFGGGRRDDIVAAQLAGQHAALPATIPAPARAALTAALRLARHERPASAAELARALETEPARATRTAGVGRGYILGVVTTVAFALGVALVQQARDPPPDATSTAVPDTPPPAVPNATHRASTPAQAPAPRRAAHEPTALAPAARDAAAVSTAAPAKAQPPTPPALEPPKRSPPRARKRKPTEPPKPEQPASTRAPPTPPPKTHRRLADGIRDPFEG